MKEAVDELSNSSRIAMLHFSEIYPFPPQPPLEGGRGEGGSFDYLKLLRGAKLTICIENNATGQFARLMKAETGYSFNGFINRYDGRPFTLEELVKEIKIRLL